MKNIMPQKSNLATRIENRPTVYPFFRNNKTYIYKEVKYSKGFLTPALNSILDSVTTKVKAAPFTIPIIMTRLYSK